MASQSDTMVSAQALISRRTVNPVGYGIISLMHPGRFSTTDAIDVLKAALEAGSNFWNAADYYGTPTYNSLHLVNAYCTKYPADAKRIVLSVKGCVDEKRQPAIDAKSVKASVESCLKILDGKCRLDLFTPSRLDPAVPIEETLGAVQEYVDAGKIGGVGLSECSGASIRKASQIVKVQVVEVELSLFETGIFSNGVVEACREFNVPIVAYSPVGRGLLTGQFKKLEDLDQKAYLKHFPRFSEENFEHNLQIVHAAEKVAKNKGCSTVQVALAWVKAQGKKVGVPVIPIPGTSTVERIKENTANVNLNEEEVEELNEAIGRIGVQGGRYPEAHSKFLSV